MEDIVIIAESFRQEIADWLGRHGMQPLEDAAVSTLASMEDTTGEGAFDRLIMALDDSGLSFDVESVEAVLEEIATGKWKPEGAQR